MDDHKLQHAVWSFVQVHSPVLLSSDLLRSTCPLKGNTVMGALVRNIEAFYTCYRGVTVIGALQTLIKSTDVFGLKYKYLKMWQVKQIKLSLYLVTTYLLWNVFTNTIHFPESLHTQLTITTHNNGFSE